MSTQPDYYRAVNETITDPTMMALLRAASPATGAEMDRVIHILGAIAKGLQAIEERLKLDVEVPPARPISSEMKARIDKLKEQVRTQDTSRNWVFAVEADLLVAILGLELR